MTTLQVHVGLGLDEMGDLFACAFKRADAGEPVNERHLSFTSLADLARALTPARLALLRHLHQLRVGDVRHSRPHWGATMRTSIRMCACWKSVA